MAGTGQIAGGEGAREPSEHDSRLVDSDGASALQRGLDTADCTIAKKRVQGSVFEPEQGSLATARIELEQRLKVGLGGRQIYLRGALQQTRDVGAELLRLRQALTLNVGRVLVTTHADADRERQARRGEPQAPARRARGGFPCGHHGVFGFIQAHLGEAEEHCFRTWIEAVARLDTGARPSVWDFTDVF